MAERKGVYHLAGSGFTSRFTWAERILNLDPHAQKQVIKELLPAATVDFPMPAARPLFSALDCTCFKNTLGLGLPAWEAGLRYAMKSSDC